MSWRALDWASKQKTGNYADKLILIILANYADDNNNCFPSLKTICTMTECSRSTVIRSLKRLEINNFIKIQERFANVGHNKRQTSNLYELNIGYQIETPQCPIDTPPSILEKPQLTNNNKPIYNSDFEMFWKAYPNRPNDNKYGAFQKFSVIMKTKEITFDNLLVKTKWFAKTQENKESKFIPHAKTWLTQKRFLDIEKPIIKKTNLNLLVG
jgi:hypothetical protein|tara:strand:+ start:959 stop:1594 length:636 start_codon:yes stop_codon:yes gene_type:complete